MSSLRASAASTARPVRAVHAVRAERAVRKPARTALKAVTTRTNDSSVVEAIDAVVEAAPAESRCPVLRAMQVPKNPDNLLTKLHGLKRLLYDDAASTQAMWLGDNTMVEQHFLGMTGYHVGSREGALEILGNEDRFKQQVHVTIDQLLGVNSLINLSGPAHKEMRDVIRPLLSPAAFDRYIPEVQTLAEDLFTNAAEGTKAGPVQLSKLIRKYPFEVVSKLVLGFSVSQDVHDAVEWAETDLAGGMFMPMIDLPFLPYGKALRARAELEAIVDQRINEVNQELAAGQQPSGLIAQMTTVIDAAGYNLTRDQIADNFILMLFAGSDTTVTVLTALAYFLMKHPQYVEELMAEQAAIQAKHGPAMSKEALQEMPFAECCIAEALRLKTPVGGMFRKAAEDTELLGYAVPKDTPVFLPFAHLLKNDPLWKNETGDLHPDVFNPHRYMNQTDRAFSLAFGSGIRRCPGYPLAMLETKVWLAVFARQYTMRLAEEPEWRGPIPHVSNGLLAYVERK